jgi:sugar phosphate isomerase/epimerase
MIKRRSFIKKSIIGSSALLLPASVLANYTSTSKESDMPKISLAQWSMHRAIKNGNSDPLEFASIAKKIYDIDAIEYVNQFYIDYGTSEKFWIQMKAKADAEGVKSLLIMVDDEGDLGNPNDSERLQAVENHYKWIHAAKILGCHAIRVNAFGRGSREEIKSALVDGLGKLAAYGASENINILIENHGLLSSDPKFIISVIEEIDNPFLGTLPDFGNWCLNSEWGSTFDNKCTDPYDPVKGITALLPYAKGVSAKSYNFTNDGQDEVLDYPKLLQAVKSFGYDGYIGIEYEGESLSEHDGILATKQLIQNVWKTLK